MATKAPLLSLAAALGALWTLGIAPARAQPSADRAGEIKTWREQCSDPDIDLRTAYVEAALAADDVAIARVCLRQSLESDNADIRNLGLRATLASVDRLLFTVKPAATLAEAQGNAKKLEALRSTYEMSHWRVLETGLVFVIEEADVSRGTSTWYPLANLSKKSHSYGGEATVIGDTVSWVGAAYLSPGKCHLRARLSEGARLEGTFKCGSLEPFPVSAALL